MCNNLYVNDMPSSSSNFSNSSLLEIVQIAPITLGVSNPNLTFDVFPQENLNPPAFNRLVGSKWGLAKENDWVAHACWEILPTDGAFNIRIPDTQTSPRRCQKDCISCSLLFSELNRTSWPLGSSTAEKYLASQNLLNSVTMPGGVSAKHLQALLNLTKTGANIMAFEAAKSKNPHDVCQTLIALISTSLPTVPIRW